MKEQARNDAASSQEAAAKVIQKAFRRSRPRPARPASTAKADEKAGHEPFQTEDSEQSKHDPEDDKLTANKRWDDALLRHKLDSSAAAASSGEKQNASERWKRSALFAQQISGGSTSQTGGERPNISRNSSTPENASLKDRIQAAKDYALYRDPDTGKRRPFGGDKEGQKAIKIKKKLEEQHWLEMIDPKHRYGSNLKYYFEEWQASKDENNGNFFHWLDYGKGKDLELKECSRSKLEKEQIQYLSAEQRRNYLVSIDRQTGRFRWAHPAREAVKATGEEHPLVDTTARRWTDMGDGKGLVPASVVSQEHIEAVSASEDMPESDSYDSDSSSSSSSSSASSVQPARPTHLRRTSSDTFKPAQADAKKEKGDVWIYVSDSSYRIYLGIKQKGKFQHSSFLAGGPITSAGTLVLRDGQLLKCNPMSGHYRTKAVYFRKFVEELERQGADLSQVKVHGTELKLWFIERANTLHAVKGKVRRLKKDVSKSLRIS